LFVIVPSFAATPALRSQIPTVGHSTRLALDSPIDPGPARTLTGRGAPFGAGVFVELWRVGPETTVADSLSSVVATDGEFSFEEVDVEPGDSFHVTLSRSWNFDRDGDFEGWDQDNSADTVLEVRDGVLRVTVRDGNLDRHRDPYFHNFFEFDPELYRVLELRIRNPVPGTGQALGVFWGSPWRSDISRHSVEIPGGMSEFETIVIPMNVGESRLLPGPVENDIDGLWTKATVDTIRIDPLNHLPRGDAIADDQTIEIDSIRIREDFRLDFHHDGDSSGLRAVEGVDSLFVESGFLEFAASDAPTLSFEFLTGRLETGVFEQFVIGVDGSELAQSENGMEILFDDDDSDGGGIDDGGSLQAAEFPISFQGRRDLTVPLDDWTRPAGEWTEDGRVPVTSLQLGVPLVASPGDRVRIDYIGWAPSDAYGPSPPIVASSPNRPPQVVLAPIPDAPSLDRTEGFVEVVFDGSLSDDGDGDSQELEFRWENISGPAEVMIENPSRAVTTVRFEQAGEYVFRVTVDDGQGIDSIAVEEIVVVVTAPPEITFRRGDVDANGRPNEIFDAIRLVRVLILSRVTRRRDVVELVCPDAADTDDNGFVELADAIGILRDWFHRRGTYPVVSVCEIDVTEDELTSCKYPSELCDGEVFHEAATARERSRQRRSARRRCR